MAKKDTKVERLSCAEIANGRQLAAAVGTALGEFFAGREACRIAALAAGAHRNTFAPAAGVFDGGIVLILLAARRFCNFTSSCIPLRTNLFALAALRGHRAMLFHRNASSSRSKRHVKSSLFFTNANCRR